MSDRMGSNPANGFSSVFRRSVELYGDYTQKPDAPRLGAVIRMPSSHPAIWGKAGPAPFRQVDTFMGADDRAAALHAASDLLNSFSGENERVTASLILAGRMLLAHDDIAAADHIIGEGSARPILDRFLFRMSCRVNDAGNEPLYNTLVQHDQADPDVLAALWLRHRWRTEGPTRTLLESFLPEPGVRKGYRRRLRECLALAFRLEAVDIAKALLARFAHLETEYDRILPLASYLAEQGGRNAASETVHAFARLHRHIEEQSAGLTAMIADADRSLAIVGNSPCEKGKGKGERIDRHHIVARFNFFSLEPEYRADYGSKFDLHVRSRLEDEALDQRSVKAGLTIFPLNEFVHQYRNWSYMRQLRGEGANIACFPPDFHRPLLAELRRDASNGLLFCAFVHQLRGRLHPESCFGFAFTDQISTESETHYSDNNPPALNHNWQKEREVFTRLVTQAHPSAPEPAP
ncbi:MAG: glycosyltransferase family 29 protein [Oceanicaulis sp.]|uniref:glycosyltransferase family 29 protein n=1 Tax=Glycocaulis sp. TaxID=1969725 RepID=UPI0025C33179|nr:glycosyltransferase family 29 protein [Glycocaulis sp.]MCC5980944.1 glycosyltransferase family 29 protein [Oceanicaulis sp.]MCH8520693.1 glycosyltransferase family 29 protein [Glycocaulis sp.]